MKRAPLSRVSYLSKVLVLSLHPGVDRTLQCFQIRYLRLNLLELVGAVYIVDGADEAFRIIQHPLHLSKLIGMCNIIDRTPQALDLNQVLFYLIELVVSFN